MRCATRGHAHHQHNPRHQPQRGEPQPSTKPMNTSVAGFNTGLAIQNASAAPTDTCWRRSAAATGAAQQLHIIPGRANSLPRRASPARRGQTGAAASRGDQHLQ